MKTLRYLTICYLALCVGKTFSRVEERVLEVYSKTDSSQDIIKETEKSLTNSLVLEILNVEDLADIQESIDKKILPKSGKFILLTKILKTEKFETDKTDEDESSQENKVKQTSEEEVEEGEEVIDREEYPFLTSVRVRFSKPNLKNILISENLFYLDKSSNRVLSLVEFDNKLEGYVYRWWEKEQLGDSNFLSGVYSFYSYLQGIFLKSGFYAIHPLFVQYASMIPERMDYGALNKETAGELARFFQSQMMVLGSVTLSSLSRSRNQLILDLHLYHAISLRKLGSYKSRVKINSDSLDFFKKEESFSWARDFAVQMSSLYQKGTLSAQLFQVVLDGALSFLEREEIKKSLVEQVGSIKSLTEEVIGSRRVEYSADVEGDDESVLESIKNLKVLDLTLSPYIKSKNHIIIKVKR